MPSADFTYDRAADCFVVTDDRGNELCRTRSPHHREDKTLAVDIAYYVRKGILIFPPTGDTKPPHVG